MLSPSDMPSLPPECHTSLAVGQQAVSKGRQGSSALNKVQVGRGCGGACPRWCGRDGWTCFPGVTGRLKRWPVGVEAERAPRLSMLLANVGNGMPWPGLHAQVLLCCIRLPRHGSDVLITLNSPIYISDKSAAAEHAGKGG